MMMPLSNTYWKSLFIWWWFMSLYALSWASSLYFVQPQWRDSYRNRKPFIVLPPPKIMSYFKRTHMHFSQELSFTFTVPTTHTHQSSRDPVQLHLHNNKGTSGASPFLSQSSSCERRCSSFCKAAVCQTPGRCWAACPPRGRASAWPWASSGCFRAHLKKEQFVLSLTEELSIRKHHALSTGGLCHPLPSESLYSSNSISSSCSCSSVHRTILVPFL